MAAGLRASSTSLIAAIIIAGLPGSAVWAIGLLVGINLLFGGATADRHGAGRAQSNLKSAPACAIWGMTSRNACAIERAMITVATSYFWYFSYDSSLAVGGSRSI